jgi:hypothetical protein
MIPLVRQANPIITYAGKNVSADWVPSITNLSWKRGIGNDKRADTISIALADPEGYFRLNYNILTKQTLQLQVETYNWNYPGEHLISDATQMEISRVEIEQSKDRGGTVIITATSIPPSTGFRLTRKSRSATGTDLKTIAGQVAKDNHMTLDYRTSVNPPVPRADQHNQSDAVFLEKFCRQYDLSYKVKDNGKGKVLTIVSMQEIEHAPPVGIIVAPSPGNRGGIKGRGIISYRLADDVEDTYSHAVVSSKDVRTGKVTTGQADAASKEPGPTHNVTKKPLTEGAPFDPTAMPEPPEGG